MSPRWIAASLAVVFGATACVSGSSATDAGVSVPPNSVAVAASSPGSSTSSTGVPPRDVSNSVSTATPVERKPITLGFAGDTSFTDGLDQRDPFGQVLDLLRGPDLMVVNLETAVADADVGSPPVAKSFLFKSPPDSLDLLVEAGVDVVALANNHTLDFGPEAMRQTLAEVDARGLARVGAGVDQEAAYQPLVMEVDGWQVGLVSLSRVPCDWSASGENVRPQVAWACPPFLDLADEMVRSTIATSDITIVMVHGGEEGVLCPSPFMVELEQHWAELGVDVVIDGHPHVLQGITSWADTLVVHSLGNFAFPPARSVSANSALVLIDVAETGVQMRIEPLRADGGVITIPTELQRTAIIDQVNRVSNGWQIDDAGVAVATPGQVGDCE